MAEKLTIFISGTMRDLPAERERVAATIQKMGLEPVWAEKRGATNRPSRDTCERMARTCHVYLGLYGLSYGWKFPPEETISATEFEWQTARRAGKPMLIYRQKGQPDPEQAAFLEKVGDWQQGHFWYEFETLDDLLPRLRDDLARLIAESFRPEQPALLADYRAHLRRLYADLPLSGIPVPLDVTLPLDRVYIKLRALPEQEEAARRKATLSSEEGEEVLWRLARLFGSHLATWEEIVRLKAMVSHDHDEESPHKLAKRLWQQRVEWEEDVRYLEGVPPIPLEEVITQHDCLIILGEAGAGKSTLLRYLAWGWAGDPEAPLPLLIPLGRADALISQTGCSFLVTALDLLTEHKAREEREALKQALADTIRDKKALFLCDGLDEVHLARRSVVAGLEKLAADGQRLVVTSRPLGYERLAAMEHFQVLPLLPEDAQAFSDRWFRALAQARGVPEAEREGWATERAGWLQRQLDERPGLREVARNPLLLTFLAVLAGDDPQRDLPLRRKELYREYVERLFTVWEARRRQEGELFLGRLRGEKARRVALWGLYRVAWHLHRAYYGGDEGPQAVRGEIEPLLARDLRERWEFGALQAEALATELLHFWERAGLLDVYRLAGQEWLAFRHLTFQEYGAARALAEAHQNDADGLWLCLSPHLLRPQWAGVIPLTLAHLSGAQATTLVERLLTANEGDKDRQPPLFLAAIALAEGAEIARAFHQQVVDMLLYLAQTRSWWEWDQKASAQDAVSTLGRLVGDEYAAVGLLALARNLSTGAWVREGAAAALGELRRTDDLLALAQDRTVGARVRVRAAEALWKLGQADNLLSMAKDAAEAAEVRGRATVALLKLERGDEAVEAWLALAQDRTVEAEMRAQAAKILLKLRRADEATEAWRALAQDPVVEAGMRVGAAKVLRILGRTGESARLLLALARDPAVERQTLEHAAEALAEALCDLGQVEKAAEFLLALTQDLWVEPWIRVDAARVLNKLGQADKAAEAWLALARDREVDVRVRERAAEALEKLERAEDLLALARDSTVAARVRARAATALGELLQATPEMLTGLWALAEEPGTPEKVRRAAREALKRLGEGE
ncbi:MAG: DUF4062 domain-containing protein [Anaerolineales bacterium]|nr:MAG: DUF4062 domain-containing protein [Anaerolineales bacterium]